MAGDATSVAVSFRWEREGAWVDLRLDKRGKTMLEEAATSGQHIPREAHAEGLTYNFKAVRESVGTGPGVYLIEATHADLPTMPDPASMAKADFHEVIDHHEELAEPEHRGEAPSFREILWYYVGMSKNLARRFEDHEQAGSALTRGLPEAIAADEFALAVSILREPTVDFGNSPQPWALDTKLKRVFIESAALARYGHDHPEAEFLNIDVPDE